MTLNLEGRSRRVVALCPTCGGDKFLHDPEDTQGNAIQTCSSCGLTITRDDLMQANSENVQEHVKEMAHEAAKDLGEHLRKSLKQAFRGNKNIRIK